MSNEYYELNTKQPMTLLGDRILVRWEEAPDEMKTKSGLLLARPAQFTKQHYTGLVLAVGDEVSDQFRDIFEEKQAKKIPMRIFFDQFSEFNKYRDPDPEIGRLAIIKESNQGCGFFILHQLRDGQAPKVESMEGNYDYNL